LACNVRERMRGGTARPMVGPGMGIAESTARTSDQSTLKGLSHALISH
jgi:hypothetical protein